MRTTVISSGRQPRSGKLLICVSPRRHVVSHSAATIAAGGSPNANAQGVSESEPPGGLCWYGRFVAKTVSKTAAKTAVKVTARQAPLSPAPAFEPAIGRIPIVDVFPQVSGGRWPAKAYAGEVIPFGATVFREGHDAVGARVELVDPAGVSSSYGLRMIGVG